MLINNKTKLYRFPVGKRYIYRWPHDGAYCLMTL